MFKTYLHNILKKKKREKIAKKSEGINHCSTLYRVQGPLRCDFATYKQSAYIRLLVNVSIQNFYIYFIFIYSQWGFFQEVNKHRMFRSFEEPPAVQCWAMNPGMWEHYMLVQPVIRRSILPRPAWTHMLARVSCLIFPTYSSWEQEEIKPQHDKTASTCKVDVSLSYTWSTPTSNLLLFPLSNF